MPRAAAARFVPVPAGDGVLCFATAGPEDGAPLPRDAGELVAALRGPVPQHFGLALVRSGPASVGILAPAPSDAATLARTLAGELIRVPADAGSEAIFDHLRGPAREARRLCAAGRLLAAALALRGRGRIAGPLDPDLLVGFGVSDWR